MTTQNIKNRIRKIQLVRSQYTLPDIDENLYLLDSEYEGELKENADKWLDSLYGKSQYEITQALCANW